MNGDVVPSCVQTVPPLTVRIDPELQFDPAPMPGIDRVPFGQPGADVLVARGAVGPPAIRGEAVARVGPPSPAWGGVPVDVAVEEGDLAREGWAIAVRAVAAARRSAEQRVRELVAREEQTARVLRRLFGVAGHDLTNLLFAAHLGVATVQRQVGATPAIDKLGRSVSGAVHLVRRIVDLGTEVLAAGPPGPGRCDVQVVLGRVREELAQDHPTRELRGDVPKVEVAVSDLAVERLLHALLSNAILHSTARVAIRGEVVGAGLTIEITNPGRLPFDDLDRIIPFEHRSERGLGAGLWIARRLADALPGVVLRVAQDGGSVKAVLGLPIESVADNPLSY